MNANTFFSRLNRLMRDNPPALVDSAVLRRFASIGVIPGCPFDLTNLQPVIAEGVQNAVDATRNKMTSNTTGSSHGKNVNGWDILPDNVGKFGTDYETRALVAVVGLGANLPEDATYPVTAMDTEGQPLSGKNEYTIHFRKGKLPPVNAF